LLCLRFLAFTECLGENGLGNLILYLLSLF
jgi:hypothetical protein